MTTLHIGDKYEVLDQIGRGGMGVVYRARHRTLQTELAVKVLPPDLAKNPELVNRFHQEARLMAQLRHPHIVRVLDVDKVGNSPYFIMEYIAGKSLSQRLQEQGPLPIPEALEIARQITSALEYAHQHDPPVIHRDIKPDNILLESSSGRVVVTDFGIAKVLGVSGYTSTDFVLGTLLYCAPEQVLQPQELDGRADLYSLGMVIYEMVSGHAFFSGLDERALLGRVLYGSEKNVPTFPESTPAEFVTLVTRAIARDPLQRYQRAVDLRQDIEHCLALCAPTVPTTHITLPTLGVTPQSYTAGPFIFPKKEKKKIWAQAARLFRPQFVLLLCVVVSVTFFLVRNLPHRPRQPLPLFTEKVPQQLLASVSEVTTAKMAEPVTITEPVEEKPVETKKDSGAPLASQSTEANMAEAVTVTEPAEAKQDLGTPPALPSTKQETFPPRRYRVTILTAVRDRPTWKGAEVLQLKPNSKISVVGFTGDWLKVESRSQSLAPSGYVWKEDAKPE
jgi:serine/threonine protein kinase